jgi:hypothetical protein
MDSVFASHEPNLVKVLLAHRLFERDIAMQLAHHFRQVTEPSHYDLLQIFETLTFQSKLKHAKKLKLFPPEYIQDLQLINEIRNAMVHEYENIIEILVDEKRGLKNRSFQLAGGIVIGKIKDESEFMRIFEGVCIRLNELTARFNITLPSNLFAGPSPSFSKTI